MMRVERQNRQEIGIEWLWVSVETVLYIAIVAAAFALRFTQLSYWPMLSGEVSEAWGAWSLLQGNMPALADYSPLLFAGNLFNFFAFGAGDFTARLWPALAGTALVLLPFLMRERLGRFGALAASALLALSPSFVYFSRTLDGSILVAASVLGFLAAASGYVAWQADPRRRRIAAVGGAVALALGLLSGPTIYTFLLALLLFALYMWLLGRREADLDGGEEVRGAWQTLRASGDLWRAAGLLGVLVLALGSALLINVGGLQATLNVLGQWLRGFTQANPAPVRWTYYAQLLTVYETLPLLAGLAGFVFALRRRDAFALFLSLWFVVALLVHTVAATRAPGSLLIILLPLVLLAGRAVDELVEAISYAELEPGNWLFLVLAAILFAFIYLQLVTFGVDGRVVYARVAVVAVGVLLLSFAIFWYWMGAEQALPVGSVALLGLLLLLTIHSTMQLNYYTARDPREPINQNPTAVTVREVRPYLIDLSLRLTGSEFTMPLLIEQSVHPLISWYAHDFRNARVVRALPATVAEPAAVTLVREDAAAPRGMVGQRFVLRENVNTQGLGWSDWIKWYLRRYEIGSKTLEHLEIWAKPE